MNSMKKALKLKWSFDMKKNFKELKAEFTGGIQAYPDFDSDEHYMILPLPTDWSGLNISCVLSQKQEEVERFIGCWVRKCNHR